MSDNPCFRCKVSCFDCPLPVEEYDQIQDQKRSFGRSDNYYQLNKEKIKAKFRERQAQKKLKGEANGSCKKS